MDAAITCLWLNRSPIAVLALCVNGASAAESIYWPLQNGDSDRREAGCMTFSMIFHAHFRSKMRAELAFIKITRRRTP